MATLDPIVVRREIKILNAGLDMSGYWTCQYAVVDSDTNDTLEGPFVFVIPKEQSANLMALITESTQLAVDDYNKP